jgi:CRP/FNR family transcriptional regulator, anaerobic regulatory protein
MHGVEIFKQIFEPELLEDFEKKATLISVKEGETILAIGQTVRVMPIVLSGVLKVSRMDEDQHELLLYYLSPKETCAMTFTCCMQQFPSEVKVTAEDDVEYLAIPITAMDEWMMKFPTWKSYVMRTIRARFNELLKSIDQLAFQKLDERLIQYLKEKSAATGSSLIQLSHEQIANEMASSREVISRLLKRLENENKLLLYRHQIRLLPDL